MNQPAEDPIREFKERQAEFEKRLIDMERSISPIKFTQLEIDSGRVFRRLDEIQKNTNITKIQTEGVSSDLLQIRESQADLRDRLIEHSEDLKAIKDKQEAHSDVLDQLINIGEEIKKTMATKDDIKIMATKDDIKIMATKDDISRLEVIMLQILNRLPKAEGE